MDRQYSKAFFHKFIDAIQKLCRDYLDFDQAVEVCGYLSLEIDNSKKERYVLSELIQNAGDVISESYCVKAFRTVRGSSSPQRKDENAPPKSCGKAADGMLLFRGEQGRGGSKDKASRSSTDSYVRGNLSFLEGCDSGTRGMMELGLRSIKKSFNNPHGNRKQSTSVSKNPVHGTSPVELLRVPQRPSSDSVLSQDASEAVPVHMFSSKCVSEGNLIPEVQWPQAIPTFNVPDSVSKSSRSNKRRSAVDITSRGKKSKDQTDPDSQSSSSALTSSSASASLTTTSQLSVPSSTNPHPQDSSTIDDVPIIVKEEGVPFMIISPQDEVLEANGEGDEEVERLIEAGSAGGENSSFLDGDALGQLLDAHIAEDMNKHTSRKTRGHVKLFQEYLVSQGITRPVQDIPPAELDNILGTFFWDIRKENGEEYEPSYLKNMQSSLERHLKHCGYSYCITRDKLFEKSRSRLKEKQSLLFQQGKGNLPNKTVFLTDQDIDLLFRQRKLGDHCPDVLLNTVWLMVSIHFGMVIKNVRDHSDLLWMDVELRVDNSGRESLSLKKCPFHSVTVDSKVPASRCFVRLYKKYRDCRARYNEDTCPFYLCPNQTSANEWFKPSCAGVNRLNNMVRRIVDGSGLPLEKKYTNSSIQMLIRGPLRATTT